MIGTAQECTESDQIYKVQCFPLFTLLLALGNPTVHYFILDIEGAELQVYNIYIVTYLATTSNKLTNTAKKNFSSLPEF